MDEEAGSQVGGDRNLHGRILVGRSAHPVARNHLVGVFDRYQGFSAGGGGQVSRDHLPAAAAFLVQREGQHGKHLRVAPVGPAVPVGPVDQNRVPGYVSALLVIDHDEVSAPVFVGGLEREGGVCTGRGNQFSFRYFLGSVALDICAQPRALVLPPPRPFDLEDGIAQGPAGTAAALLVYAGNAEQQVFPGFGLIREADTHIMGEGGVGIGFGGETLIAARFDDGRYHKGVQHAGRLFGRRQVNLDGSLSVGIQGGLIERMCADGEIGHRRGKHIALQALKGRFGRAEGHFCLGLQSGGGRSRKPGSLYLYRQSLAGVEHPFGEERGNLQAVGFDGFEMERFVEMAATHFHMGVPEAGGIVGAGGNAETEHAVLARLDESRVELSFGGEKFQRSGMAVRDDSFAVVQDHRHKERIAGPPDAPFAIKIGLDAIGDHLSAYIEAAGGALAALEEFQVGFAAAFRRDGHEGFAFGFQGEQTLGIGFPGGQFLQLEVVQANLGPAQRTGGRQVGGDQGNLSVRGSRGQQTDVGCHQVHGREPVGIHIIGRLFGVFPVTPVVFVPVHPILPIPCGRLIPFGLLAVRRRSVGRDQGYLAVDGFFAVEGIRFPETQPDAVQGARLAVEQLAQVKAVIVPLLQVPGSVSAQGDAAPVHQTAAAAQAVASVELVVLQEHKQVVLINPDHAYIYCIQGHGAEGEQQPGTVGKDVAFQRNLYGGFGFDGIEGLLKNRSQGTSAEVFDPAVHPERHLVGPAVEIDQGLAPLQFDVTSVHAFQLNHAGQGRVPGQGVREGEDQAVVFLPHIGQAEIASGGHIGQGNGFFGGLDGKPENKVPEFLFLHIGHLIQMEGGLIGASGHQSVLVGNEFHRCGGIPDDRSLQVGPEREQAVGKLPVGGNLGNQFDAERRLRGDDPACMRFDVLRRFWSGGSLGSSLAAG